MSAKKSDLRHRHSRSILRRVTGGHACRKACGDGADGVGVLSPRLSNKLLQEHQGRRDDWVFVTHRFSAHGAFWEQQNFLWARTLLGGA